MVPEILQSELEKPGHLKFIQECALAHAIRSDNGGLEVEVRTH